MPSALYCVCMHVHPLSSDACSSFQFIPQFVVTIILNNKQKDSVESNSDLILGPILVILTHSPGKFTTEYGKCYMCYQTLKYTTVNKVYMIIDAENKLIPSSHREPWKSNINILSFAASWMESSEEATASDVLWQDFLGSTGRCMNCGKSRAEHKNGWQGTSSSAQIPQCWRRWTEWTWKGYPSST